MRYSPPPEGASGRVARRSDDRSARRVAAWIEAFRLVLAAQEEPKPDRAEIDALIETADRNRWTEVSLRARSAAILHVLSGGGRPQPIIEEMCRGADMSGEPILVASALAFRSSIALTVSTDGPAATAAAEVDLIRAVVLLEQGGGDPLERVSAHTGCGIGFRALGLWELASTHYRAAAEVDPIAEAPDLAPYAADVAAMRRRIVYNVVDLETNRACALRVAGDSAASCAHAAQATLDFEAICDDGSWPASWVDDLEVCALVTRALCGTDVSHRAQEVCSAPGAGPMRVGHARLALALSLAPARVVEARQAAEAAIECLQGSESAEPVTLAMELAAELEAAPAGRRVAKTQTERLSHGQRRSVDSIQALLGAERLRVRSAQLERHAHVDDLTGLANRRGFYRSLERLVADDAPEVAVLVVDIDRFKEINDRHGHLAGDRILQTVGLALVARLDAGDHAARVGGDEFFVLLAATNGPDAIERAHALRREIATSCSVSVSIGVASGPPRHFERLLSDADLALYRSKSLGGGRCVEAPTAGPPPT